MNFRFCLSIVGAFTTIGLFTNQLKAATILIEDFEDGTVTYAGTPVDDTSDIFNNDYYGRIDGTSGLPINVSYNGKIGDGFYAVQDTDGATISTDIIQLDWVGIDTSAFTNLSLSWYVAEDDSEDGNEDWDFNSSFRISVQADGGGFVDVFAIASEIIEGDQINELARVDTDFDGIGDGAEITNEFTQFSVSLANTSTLDIRIIFEELNAGDEDLAFDQLELTGDPVPEPSSALLALISLSFLIRRRRI